MTDYFITDKSKDLLLFLFTYLMIVRIGGFSFLFKLMLRVLRVEFRSEKLKRYNDHFFDVQMYRLLNGVNVACIDDAALIEENITNGRFKRASFWFTGFFGPIGYKKFIGPEIIVIGFIFTLSAVRGITLLTDTIYNYKIGYATLNLKHEKLYISPDEIYNVNASVRIDKKHCEQYKNSLPEIYSEACNYIISTSKEKIDALIYLIKKEREAAVSLIYIGFGFLSIAAILFFGFITFNSLNKEICDIKDSIAEDVT